MAAKRIAIACQGGGINAAFTWGVLRTILAEKAARDAGSDGQRFDICGLSGTSAGALCAFMTWYGLANKGGQVGSPEVAVAALDHLWETFAARTPAEIAFNAMAVGMLRAQSRGLPAARVSPYNAALDMVMSRLDRFGLRPEFYDFGALMEACAPDFEAIDQGTVTPRLLIGAVEVLSGNFVAFDSAAEPGSRRGISLAAVRASGTLSEVRKAEQIDGVTCVDGVCRDGYFWDGLFSQNPPIREFVSRTALDRRPDEIWVVRINPQEQDDPPESFEDIEDRRNELAGNLSMNQELAFIQTVNGWCSRFPEMLCDRKQITVRTIKMSKSVSDKLDVASKFDRAPSFIEKLRREGETRASEWLASWPDGVGAWPADAVYADGEG